MKQPAVLVSLAAFAVILAIGNIFQLISNHKLRERVSDFESAAVQREAATKSRSLTAVGTADTEKEKSGKSSAPTTDGDDPRVAGAQPENKPGESFADLAEKYAKSVEDNPAIQKQMLAQFEAQLGNVLDDLYEHFGLEGEELKHFKSLMAEHWRVQSQTPMQLMSAMGDDAKTQAIKEELVKSRAEIDGRIQEFLNSDDDFAHYQAYRDQIPDRIEVDQYRDAMDAGGQQLNADQEAQLIAAMAEERTATGLGDLNDPVQWETEEFNEETIVEVMDQMSEFHDRVQTRAGGILEQDQISILAESQSNIRQQQELGMRFGLRMMEAMRPREGTAPPVPTPAVGDGE